MTKVPFNPLTDALLPTERLFKKDNHLYCEKASKSKPFSRHFTHKNYKYTPILANINTTAKQAIATNTPTQALIDNYEELIARCEQRNADYKKRFFLIRWLKSPIDTSLHKKAVLECRELLSKKTNGNPNFTEASASFSLKEGDIDWRDMLDNPANPIAMHVCELGLDSIQAFVYKIHPQLTSEGVSMDQWKAVFATIGLFTAADALKFKWKTQDEFYNYLEKNSILFAQKLLKNPVTSKFVTMGILQFKPGQLQTFLTKIHPELKVEKEADTQENCMKFLSVLDLNTEEQILTHLTKESFEKKRESFIHNLFTDPVTSKFVLIAIHQFKPGQMQTLLTKINSNLKIDNEADTQENYTTFLRIIGLATPQQVLQHPSKEAYFEKNKETLTPSLKTHCPFIKTDTK